MRKATFLLLAALLAGGTLIYGPRALAQDEPNAEALVAAKELVAFISPDMISQLTKGLEAQMWPPMERGIRNRIPTIDEATLSDIRTAMNEATQAFLEARMPGLAEASARAYARRFTADELHEVTAFYKTPTGGKLLRLLPETTTEATADYIKQIPQLSAAVQNEMVGILRERGYLK